jgi:succinyl-CoA:acetate CoA-transferase
MDRVRNSALRGKITTAAAAARLIKGGMMVGVSGFTVVGYPKAVPREIAGRAQAERLGITIISGGSVGDQLDGALARAGAVIRRYGFQSNADLRRLINADQVKYVDIHVNHIAYYLRHGYLGKIDAAIVEVAGLDEAGNLIPPCSVGIMDVLVERAERIILEVNHRIPAEIETMHDIFALARAPHTQPIPITSAGERIGDPFVRCAPQKIAAIVLTDEDDANAELMAPNDDMRAIAGHIVAFLKKEMASGRLCSPPPPFQSGLGGVSNAVLLELGQSDLTGLSVYTEVMQDAVLELIDAGKINCASGSAITISPSRKAEFYRRLKEYQGKILLRPQEISNSPEVIRRLGVIAMNTAIEADLSGNVNSTHIDGVNIMNGIGGSGDYARNAGLNIFMTPSTARNGTVSCLVPHVGHVDHSEHDTQILVTEQGLADLRGLTAYERADLIIKCCAHPKFRPALRNYADRAYRQSTGKHAIARL